MEELSLHILDIAKNSVKAKASLIKISIDENKAENLLKIEIEDNGCGMSKDFLKTVKDPFKTTRTTRKVGMGLSLFEAAAIRCGGGLEVFSEIGVGTRVVAVMELDNIDRAPIGDMAGTMTTLISGSPEIDFVYTHKKGEAVFEMDTAKLREILGDVPLSLPEIVLWIDGYIKEGLAEIM